MTGFWAFPFQGNFGLLVLIFCTEKFLFGQNRSPTAGFLHIVHIIWFGNHRFSSAPFCKKIKIASICLISEFDLYLKCLLEPYSIRILIPQIYGPITSHHWSLECQPDTYDYISPYFVLAYIKKEFQFVGSQWACNCHFQPVVGCSRFATCRLKDCEKPNISFICWVDIISMQFAGISCDPGISYDMRHSAELR